MNRDFSAEIAPASIFPQPEEELVEAVAATGKPLAVVLMNGSALAVNWINEHANAVLDAWYPGEEGGAAVAETLSGKNNPAGRLPVTFYNGVNQLPNFEDYGMANRTYRYFNGKPLYPFGYGLSYTTFNYSDLSVPMQAVAAGQPVGADVTVTNTGKVAGDEVVQVYLKFPAVKGAPLIALRGFQRIHLEAGASQKVHFDLKDRDLGMVTEDGNPIIAQGDYTISIGGGQPDTGAPGVTGKFHIEGQIACRNRATHLIGVQEQRGIHAQTGFLQITCNRCSIESCAIPWRRPRRKTSRHCRVASTGTRRTTLSFARCRRRREFSTK